MAVPVGYSHPPDGRSGCGLATGFDAEPTLIRLGYAIEQLQARVAPLWPAQYRRPPLFPGCPDPSAAQRVVGHLGSSRTAPTCRPTPATGKPASPDWVGAVEQGSCAGPPPGPAFVSWGPVWGPQPSNAALPTPQMARGGCWWGEMVDFGENWGYIMVASGERGRLCPISRVEAGRPS